MAFRPPALPEITLLGLLLVSTGAFAQAVVVSTIFDPPSHAAGLRIERAMLVEPTAVEPVALRLDPGRIETQRTEVSLIGSAVVLEMGRLTADGRFVRPRLTIGRQSHELRNWMGSIGIPAERCMLPLFRGRLKRQESGELGAAVWISARCTFY